MKPGTPKEANDKYNLYTREEIKKAVAELDEVKEQIEKRSEQLKNMLQTNPDIKVKTIPGNISLKEIQHGYEASERKKT